MTTKHAASLMQAIFSTRHVASLMQAIFSEYGWPDTIGSDNGLCYNATKFKQAMKDMGVHHINKIITLPSIQRMDRKCVQIVNACCLKPRG